MKLETAAALRRIESQDWFEYYTGLSPVPNFHPPSLKNPKRVPQRFPQRGWRRGDSPSAKRLAKDDMREIIKRLRRQIGKPELAVTAPMPLFPDIQKWL